MVTGSITSTTSSGLRPSTAAATSALSSARCICSFSRAIGCTRTSTDAFEGIGCAVAGTSPEALRVAVELVQAVGGRPFEVSDDPRRLQVTTAFEGGRKGQAQRTVYDEAPPGR